METEIKRHKRGDVREDGLLFFQYSGTIEQWVTAEKMEQHRLRKNNKYQSSYASDPEFSKRDRDRKKTDEARAMRRARQQKEREENPQKHEEMLEYMRAWRKKVAEDPTRYVEQRAKRRASQKAYKALPLVALADRMRRRIKAALVSAGYSKRSKTMDIVGLSQAELKAHIESLFTDGMSWERLSEIHIDHILPLASATNEEEILALCHYTNLQPLWALDNLKKGDRILN